MAKILIVDDVVHIRELMNKAFSLEGYQVTTVPSAEQALAIIFQEPFDLIILDVQLGEASGVALLKKIREKNSWIPVVIFSGVISPALECECRAAGATDVLQKDTEMSSLIQQIGKILKAKDRIVPRTAATKQVPILIVDDQENIRSLLKNFFNTKGYRVLEAENGEKALDIVRSTKVSAVLLDIQMPGMDGLETLKKLLAINPRLGVVMVTGVADDDKVRAAIAAGAYNYVLKPFDFLYLDLVVLSRLAIAESGD